MAKEGRALSGDEGVSRADFAAATLVSFLGSPNGALDHHPWSETDDLLLDDRKLWNERA